MISDTEQIDHARSHFQAAIRNLENSQEHLDAWADHAEVEKMAGAHLSKAAFEIGAAATEHKNGKKHVDSLIGRKGWDGESDFESAKAATVAMGNELKMAGEHHAALSDAINDDSAARTVKRHKDLREHLASAISHGKDAEAGIGKCLEARAKSAKAASPKGELHFEKSDKGVPSDRFEIYAPITKVRKRDDGSLVVEAWANVADLIDSDGEYLSEEGLESFLKSWEPFGNFRLQHDPSEPAGTIRQPTFGKAIEVDGEPLGAWIVQHPETKTKGIFCRSHAISDKAIKYISNGLMTGLSIGGTCTKRIPVEVEVDENGVVVSEMVLPA